MKKWALFSIILLLLLAWPSQAQNEESTNFLQLINDYRNLADFCWNNDWFEWPVGSQTLSVSTSLTQAAADHNDVMISQNCFAHVCPGEAGVAERVNDTGYRGWRFLSENIAAGMSTAQQAFDAWRESDGHNKNMLACRARAIGITRTFGNNTDFGWYWTTDFGDIVESSPPPPPVEPPSPPDPVEPRPTPTGDCFTLDHNNNNLVDDDEVLGVIDLWVRGAFLCR